MLKYFRKNKLRNNEVTYISYLSSEDALSLSHLMVSNKERFQEFLPQTLAQNLSLSDSKLYIENRTKDRRNKTMFTFAIKLENSEDVAGLIVLKEIDWDSKEAEFAYCIGANFEGKGIMTQSINEVITTAFSEFELSRLKIIVHKTNIASTRIAQKAGFTWKETLENEHIPIGGAPLNMELYELEKKENLKLSCRVSKTL